jgi:hypothetical protein
MDTKGFSETYRKSPFIIQAACAGDAEVFKTLLALNATIYDSGYICLSKKRKNQVSSNVLGAAAYHGNSNIIKSYIKKFD